MLAERGDDRTDFAALDVAEELDEAKQRAKALKDKREQMPADAYLDQLQKLLLQLADVQGKIDAAQGKTQ